MKNFLRALRCAWPYRGRLVLSFLCALLAAVLWSLSFTSIYPVLTTLSKEITVQEWADQEIKHLEKYIRDKEAEREIPAKETRERQEEPASTERDKRLRDLTNRLAKLDSDLQSANRALYRTRLLKWYCERFLPNDRFRDLVCIIAVVVAAVAIRGFFEFWQESLVGSVVNLSLFDLRNRFYRNVIHLDVSQFSDTGTNDLMARFTNDTELLGTGLKTIFGKMISEPLKAFGSVLVAAWISWQLTLMFLVLVPIAVFIMTKVGRTIKRATRRLLERMSSIYKILQESFQGIRVVKAFTMEPYERRRFCSATKDYYYKAMRVVNMDALAGPIIEFVGVAAIAAALLLGAYLVVNDQTHIWGLRMTGQPMEAAALLTLYTCLAAIADPVRKLSSVYTRINSAAAAADRIFSALDKQPRVSGNSNNPRMPRHEQAIELRDVCFSYDPGHAILTDVHLHVRFGETIALVGRNGCGKTTLVGLIPRFFDPDHGSILIDGHDIRHVHLRSLRQQIGIVTQETILFDDTIYNNIAYGNRHARREDVEEAAQRAYAHDFILSLPHGYDTRVGEAGAKLSGGQKQRLALARAILRDPSILILDEFTSQSDVESEALIHKALREFMRDRTTFVITHRLNTLEIADRIVVLEHGRIVAVGTHPELLGTCSAYQRLHEAWFQRPAA
jgi:subfamily B ATP-binding cassette protein MsbA